MALAASVTTNTVPDFMLKTLEITVAIINCISRNSI